MPESPFTGPDVAMEITRALVSSAASYHARVGERTTWAFVDGLLAALAADLPSRRNSALRAYLGEALPREVARGLGWTDLRRLCSVVRGTLLVVLERSEGDGPLVAARVRPLEDWLHELTLTSALHFTAHREETIAEQAAQVEAQLAEMRLLAEERRDAVRDVLRALWVPIAPIYDGIVVVPLVGAIDPERAGDLMTRLLGKVAASGVRFVLVDIGGVPVIDAPAAAELVRLAAAARLVGAEIVLVGISAATAQTLVKLGIELGGIITRSTLRQGLMFALGRMGLRICRGP